MSRRTSAPTRVVLPDPKFGSEMLAKFMNMVMTSGKKSAAEHIVYGAIDRISEKTDRHGDAALEVLSVALENVKPAVEVKSRRVGGATYQVPVEVPPGPPPDARDALADRGRARPQREVDGAPPGPRADGRRGEPRHGRAQARRHAPHGGGQQGLRSLPLVRKQG